MPDEADRAQQDTEVYLQAMKTDYTVPKGESGICIDCDQHSPRLIDKRCASCRDEIAEIERRRKGR